MKVIISHRVYRNRLALSHYSDETGAILTGFRIPMEDEGEEIGVNIGAELMIREGEDDGETNCSLYSLAQAWKQPETS